MTTKSMLNQINSGGAKQKRTAVSTDGKAMKRLQYEHADQSGCTAALISNVGAHVCVRLETF